MLLLVDKTEPTVCVHSNMRLAPHQNMDKIWGWGQQCSCCANSTVNSEINLHSSMWPRGSSNMHLYKSTNLSTYF